MLGLLIRSVLDKDLRILVEEGSVSGSGTGPLDSQATGPVPDTESRGPVVHFNVPLCVDILTNTLNLSNSYEIVIISSIFRHIAQAE